MWSVVSQRVFLAPREGGTIRVPLLLPQKLFPAQIGKINIVWRLSANPQKGQNLV